MPKLKTVEWNTLLQRLKQNDSDLNVLILDNKEIEDEGTIALAEALQNNTMLIKLSLASNNISNKGAQAISNTLKINTTLAELNLEDNHLGRGIMAIAAALKSNTSLTCLTLDLKPPAELFKGILADAIQKNTTLTMLILRKDDINKTSYEIENLIKRNQNLQVQCHAAAEAGQLDRVLDLLDQGVGLFSLSKNGNTILHWAALEGHSTLVQFLIQRLRAKNNPLNFCNWKGETAMELAKTPQIAALFNSTLPSILSSIPAMNATVHIHPIPVSQTSNNNNTNINLSTTIAPPPTSSLLPVINETVRNKAIRNMLMKLLLDELKQLPQSFNQKPSCFICYAWGMPKHEKWIQRELAEHLTIAGVEVKLDVWHNKAGTWISEHTQFISSCDVVIVACSEKMMEKYNNKQSGAVVSLELEQVFAKLKKQKTASTVLTLLLDGTEDTAKPPFLHGNVHVDFTDKLNYTLQLLKLLERIYVSQSEAAVQALQRLYEQHNSLTKLVLKGSMDNQLEPFLTKELNSMTKKKQDKQAELLSRLSNVYHSTSTSSLYAESSNNNNNTSHEHKRRKM